MLGFRGWISQKQIGKTLIRLLLQKQSDLDLHGLSWQQVTSVRNFGTFTVARPPDKSV